MAQQPPLFDDAASIEAPPSRSMALRAQPGQPLTKSQKTFNRLVAQIEQRRRRLDADKELFEEALVYHAQHLRHRIASAVTLRKNVVRALAPFLDDRRLKKGDVRVLESILIGQLDDILAHADVVEDDVRALFERLHGADLTTVEDAEMEVARADMEDMFAEMGIDVDLSGVTKGMSDEDLAAQAAQLADELKRHAAESETRSRSTRRRTKREQREEDLRQRAEEARKISLGSIYRQLAKVLHPDLEQDPEQRTRKGALMQQLTTAYASQDLHTLLRLQLEWVYSESADIARLADERLDAYNLVLKEQVAELERARAALPHNPRFQPLVEDRGPYGTRVRTNGPAEAQRLDDVASGLQSALEALQAPHALKHVRLLIREQRATDRVRFRLPIRFPY